MYSASLAAVAALALGSTAAGSTATLAASHAHSPSCSQILPVQKLDKALFGAAPNGPAVARFSGLRVFKGKKWYYPYNRGQAQAGSFCEYLWQASDVPADYQASFGPPSGPTLGADVIVGSGLSTKNWQTGKASAESVGVGQPSDFPPDSQHSLHLGSGTRAFDEDTYTGTGPTYNDIAVYVLTRHHGYFAVYAWDATLAQLKNVAATVLAYKNGSL